MLRSIPPGTMTNVMRERDRGMDRRTIINFGMASIKHSAVKRGQECFSSLWDGSVKRHIYKKKPSDRLQMFEERIAAEQIQNINTEIKDLQQFFAEGIPGVEREIGRLKARLVRFKE